MQSSWYSLPATTTPFSVIRSTPLPSVSTRCVPGMLNACRYSSWKHGRLQSWPYQALSLPAVSRSPTMASTRLRISSIFSKSESSKAARMFGRVRSSRGNCWILARIRRDRSVQPSWTRSSSGVAAGLVRGEILQPALLPAGRSDRPKTIWGRSARWRGHRPRTACAGKRRVPWPRAPDTARIARTSRRCR